MHKTSLIQQRSSRTVGLTGSENKSDEPPLNVSVLAFAAMEQKVNFGRIMKGQEFRDSQIMKGVAMKTAKVDAIKKAVSGSADRAFAMRSKAEEIKEIIVTDIRKNPNEPHMWSQITREVAFGGEGAINHLLPVDMNSIQAEFAKIKTAQLEAEQEAGKTKKKAIVEIEESPAEALHGFNLQLDDVEREERKEDEDEDEESDDDEMDKVPTLPNSMPSLAFINNKAFKEFTAKAVGKDADELANMERRRKKQRERKGQLFPDDGDIVDAETGRLQEVNYTSWIHPKDAPDEYKTTKVLGALGKFKKNLTILRNEGSGGAERKEESRNAVAIPKQKEAQQPPSQQPASEVDWEAKAAMFLKSAVSEDASSIMEERDEMRKKVEVKTGRRVIMATKYEKPGSRGHIPDINAAVTKLETERRLGRAGRNILGGGMDDAERLMNATAGVVGENSVISDFEYYDPNERKGVASTPVVDIGAADNLSDLFKWANTDAKRGIAELSVLKNRKNEELMDLVRAEEDRETERKRIEKAAKHPSILARARHRHKREREERQRTITRIRQENEMIIAGKMASLGLIR
mmetsp:Transcript_9890/g.20104  ORF Transcript_9890/g.20104 Transcript_9890/m.20104 type:complete len:576 (+) Transcript_9890:103-1830(+)